MFKSPCISLLKLMGVECNLHLHAGKCIHPLTDFFNFTVDLAPYQYKRWSISDQNRKVDGSKVFNLKIEHSIFSISSFALTEVKSLAPRWIIMILGGGPILMWSCKAVSMSAHSIPEIPIHLVCTLFLCSPREEPPALWHVKRLAHLTIEESNIHIILRRPKISVRCSVKQ
jgi:hypothetical protein